MDSKTNNNTPSVPKEDASHADGIKGKSYIDVVRELAEELADSHIVVMEDGEDGLVRVYFRDDDKTEQDKDEDDFVIVNIDDEMFGWPNGDEGYLSAEQFMEKYEQLFKPTVTRNMIDFPPLDPSLAVPSPASALLDPSPKGKGKGESSNEDKPVKASGSTD